MDTKRLKKEFGKDITFVLPQNIMAVWDALQEYGKY